MEVAVVEVTVEGAVELPAREAASGERSAAEARTPERASSEPAPVRCRESAAEPATAVCHAERVCRAAGERERQDDHEEKDGESLEREDQRPFECRELHGRSQIGRASCR